MKPEELLDKLKEQATARMSKTSRCHLRNLQRAGAAWPERLFHRHYRKAGAQARSAASTKYKKQNR